MSLGTITRPSQIDGLNCPASTMIQAVIPLSRKNSKEAEEGTFAHKVLEHCLTLEYYYGVEYNVSLVCEELYAREISKPYLSLGLQEVALHVGNTLEFISEVVSRHKNPIIYSEVKLPMPDGVADGSADVVIVWEDIKHVAVIDFKYGQHIKVPASSKQLRAYGASAMKVFQAATVEVHIYQPRMSDGGHTEVHYSAMDLMDFEEEVSEKVKYIRTQADKGVIESTDFIPTASSCRFCPVKPICPAHINDLANTIKAVVDNEKTNVPLDQLVSTQLDSLAALVLAYKDKEKFVKAAEDFILQKLQEGEQINGVELGRTTGRREIVKGVEATNIVKWLQQNGVAVKSDEDISTAKLFGLSDFEKLIKKMFVNDKEKQKEVLALFEEQFVGKSEGTPKLVKISAMVVKEDSMDFVV